MRFSRSLCVQFSGLILTVMYLGAPSWNIMIRCAASVIRLLRVFILSGIYRCTVTFEEGDILPQTAWEVLTLCLAVWIAVKHFFKMQRPPKGWITGDCFTALMMKSHLVFFPSFFVKKKYCLLSVGAAPYGRQSTSEHAGSLLEFP
ncbi:hypothetical protein BDR05DRAFT_15108 [Suillus weaverae]|nr:hypothetical protein BDR05DRAFT_15108 [Suillus weaverae]